MRIAWISDFDLTGSGYLNLSVPMCEGLAKNGHDVKAIGLHYKGQQHDWNFSVFPTGNLEDAFGVLQNLLVLWKFDILFVALDIFLQAMILQRLQNVRGDFKYIGIMPVEADPLCMSWAMILMQMDKPLIISEFGANEAKKAGVMNAEHLQLGINTKIWRFPTPEERDEIRSAFAFDDEMFVLLTVADNQERKNLSRTMEIFAEFAEDKENTRYVLVTREHNVLGWRLRDYAQVLGMNNKFILLERGMDFKKLWAIYAMSDCFILTSKAEGLGLPLLEAMAVGVPCIATNCTAIPELLGDNRGLLVPHDYKYVDPFGNGHRYWASKDEGVKLLQGLFDGENVPDTAGAREYVEGRTWEIAVDQLENAMKEMKNG